MAVRAVPGGYTTVTPWIISEDTGKMIAFLQAAFGAEELGRVTSEAGHIGHAEVRIGDAVVMLFDRPATDTGILQKADDGGFLPSPAYLRLYVEDCDAVYARALEAGATSVTEVEDFFSERVGRVRDPLGNVWWLQTHVRDMDAEEIGKLAKTWMEDKGF